MNYYSIPENIDLIIIDAHDTIFIRDLTRSPQNVFLDPQDREQVVWHIRDGFYNFVEYYSSVKGLSIVISSDGDRGKLLDICNRFGIAKFISEIYGFKHIDRQSYLKQLDLILEQTRTEKDKAIFIGDSDIDRRSAQKYGINFIQVPNTAEDRRFSFNKFLDISFTSGLYGLDLHKISNLRHIYHNLSTPNLVEMSIECQEGMLVHLGSLFVDTGLYKDYIQNGRYIVKEPSSEGKIHWEREDFAPMTPRNFQMVFLRLQAFLQGRDIYIQDCYAGAHQKYQMPVRIINQTAWHNLFARNMLIQASEQQMESFFPEYTIFHVPFFKAIPELDQIETEAFIIVNLSKKLVIIGGTHYAGEIRRAFYILLSYFYLQEDILPIRCSSNQGPNRDLALFWGMTSRVKSSVTMDDDRNFFGDAYHCWTKDSIFNLEWGCYMPVANLNKENSPRIHSCAHRFGTILENIHLRYGRRIDFSVPNCHGNARATFPISHFRKVDRSGVSPHPAHTFIFMSDQIGIFPMMSKVSKAQAIFYLLMGYVGKIPAYYTITNGIEQSIDFARLQSDFLIQGNETQIRQCIKFKPFFNDYPFVFHPSTYALLLWEKLERSDSQCWLINATPNYLAASFSQTEYENLIQKVIKRIFNGIFSEKNLQWDESFNFHQLHICPAITGDESIALEPEAYWNHNYGFVRNIVIQRFLDELSKYDRDLDLPIQKSAPVIKK